MSERMLCVSRFDHQTPQLKMFSDCQHQEGEGQGFHGQTILHPPASALPILHWPLSPCIAVHAKSLAAFRTPMSLLTLFLLPGRTLIHLAG